MGTAKSCSSWTMNLFQILQHIFFLKIVPLFFPLGSSISFLFLCSSPSAKYHVEALVLQEPSQDSVFSVQLCLFPLTIIFFYQLETLRVFEAVSGNTVSYSSPPDYALTHCNLASLVPPPCFSENEGSLKSSVTFTITNCPIFISLST